MLILTIVITVTANGCVSTGQLEPPRHLKVEKSAPTSTPTVKETIFSEDLEIPYIPARGLYEPRWQTSMRGRLRNERPRNSVPQYIDPHRIELEPLFPLNIPKPAITIERVWNAYRNLQFVDTIALAGAIIYDERHTPETKAKAYLLGGAAAYLLDRREPAEAFFRQALVLDSSIEMDARMFPKHLRSCFEGQRAKRRTP